MPAIAAHYKFGQLVADRLSEAIRHTIIENKELFDLATQGPDLLFYNNPFKKNDVSELGVRIHDEPARKFFDNILERKVAKNPQILAYVLGALCHYGLDRACHPYVNAFADGDSARHTSLESDFDLVIIRRYEMYPKRYIYLPAKVDYAVIAAVYNITSDEVRRCLSQMRNFNRLFDFPSVIGVADNILKKQGVFSGLTLKKEPLFVEESEMLIKMFDGAVESTACLVEEFYKAVTQDKQIADNLEHNFDGVVI